jgi:hypothetical protein
LIGEAGTGKTTELKIARLAAEISGAFVHFVDLGEVGGATDLTQQVFGGLIPEATSGRVYLFLDAFDECQFSLENLGAILARELRRLPETLRNRLSLRIATRGGVWPSTLETELGKLWPDRVGVFQITPLRETDVAAIATQNGVANPDEFLHAIRIADAMPLAARPLTLRLLVNVYVREGQLPRRRGDLYERGCRELCEEQNPYRRDACRVGRLAPEQRLTLARRIAAGSILCGRPIIWLGTESDCPSGAVVISELCGGTEAGEGGEFEVSAERIRETIHDTGLFHARGAQGFGWAHRSFGEYLAASYLAVRNVPVPQVVNLLFHPAAQGRVVPQLRAVAAWLAGVRLDVFRLLVDRDPTPLLSADTGGLSNDDRAAAVVAILKAVRDGQMHDGALFTSDYRRLSHPGLAGQLRPVVRDQTETFLTRRVAIDMAESSELQELQHDLADVALDSTVGERTRAQAARALVRIGDTAARARLQALLSLPPEEDPNDELRGCALRALWPERRLPLSDILAAIGPSHAPNFFGAYQAFIEREFGPSLTDDDLPEVLDWLARFCPTLYEHSEFANLSDSLLLRASDALDRQNVVSAMARAVWARISRRDNLLNRIEDGQQCLFGDDDEHRRQLLDEIMPLAAGEMSNKHALRGSGLVRPTDVAWLILRLDDPGTSQEVRSILAHLVADLFCGDDPNRYDPILEAARRHPVLQAEIAFWTTDVPLDSEAARSMREAYRQRQEWEEHLQEKPVLDQPPRERVQKRLECITAGKLDEWFNLTRDLTLEPTSRHYGLELASNLTETPGWQEAAEPTRSRILGAASAFLVGRDPLLDNWFDKPESYGYAAIAGFKALRLLRDAAPQEFARIQGEVWERWLPAVLTFPNSGMEGEELAQQELIAEAYRRVPSQTLACLRRVIARENEMELARAIARRMQHCWDEPIAEVLREVIRTPQAWLNVFPQTLEDLIRKGDSEAIERARELLVSPIPTDPVARKMARQAARAVLTYASRPVWPTIEQLLTAEPDFAAEVMLAMADESPFGSQPDWIEQLTESQVADLYIWLARRFPQTEDPRHEGGLMSPRDAMTHFRDGMLTALVARGTFEAVTTLDYIVRELPNSTSARWVRVDAEKRALEENWVPPKPGQMLRLVRDGGRRLVRSATELLQVVVDSLVRYEAELQGETPGNFTLWDRQADSTTYRPKEENRLSDGVKLHLERDLRNRGVVANREVEIRAGNGSGERTDVHVIAFTQKSDGTIDRVRVIIEVKGCWYRAKDGSREDVNKAMEVQLRDRYLRDNDCRHGLYIVGWFLGDRWSDTNDSRKADARRLMQPTLVEARDHFAQQAAQLSVDGVALHAMVINAALR